MIDCVPFEMPRPKKLSNTCATGRRAKKINGSAHAATSGILSTREASVQPASTSGLKRSASHVVDGHRIRTGMNARACLVLSPFR